MTPERLTPEREAQIRAMDGNYVGKDELGREIDALRSQVDELAGALQDSPCKCKCDTHGYGCGLEEATCRRAKGQCQRCKALSNPAIAKRLADAEELRAAIDEMKDCVECHPMNHVKRVTALKRLAAARDRMWGSKSGTAPEKLK